ncbi:oligosaccharide flippase family protein [Novosphingobium bradum]|uniref:Oligosaccharide flippase family protein n=1 Tax=Novosphingobium bradum TaxID=1737444 RepID=A0ABV7INY9_9SPHN
MDQSTQTRGSVRRSLAWTYGTHLVVFAVSFASAVIVSRLLTPRELGVFGVGMAVAAMLGAISQFGLANYLIRDHELSRQTIAVGFTVNALVGLAAGGLLLLLGTAGQAVFSDPAIARTLRVLALVPVIGIFEFLPATLLIRDRRFGQTSLVQLGKAMVNAITVIGFAQAGWGYLSPAIAAVAGAAFGAVAFNMVGFRHISFRLSLRGGWTLAVFAVHMMSAGGVSILAPRLAELVVAQMLGLGALGLYTRASGLAAMIWEGAYGLSTRVIYIQMAAELRERGTLKQTFLHATRLLIGIMWPAMAGLAVISGPVVHLLYGPQWAGAALPLSALMIGQVIAIGFAMNWELCVLTGRTGWQARIEIARALLGLAGFALGALVSLPVAAMGRIVDVLLGYVVYRPRMGEMAGASAAEVRGAYAGGLWLTVAAIAPAAGVMALAGWAPEVPLARIAVAIVAGAGLWATALRALRHPLFDELAAVLGKKPGHAHG